ncbi:hypothetical protein AVEN_172550-1 [Araneus ventricosus]|uniref:Uncharacterized protein n=1 Tax=Araneus ventricosus TaxID=182803 RepID=A0A4Y2UX24_ARAVE|nr:hypothetical protein AVEN_247662-1 [Araneus ventricosus]GBO17569.1 hypothetical protein AVEN_141865-1 [Araneus ventricosus]GBO18094.1 hypothetical protein AVEN_240844-1 [Araneus ventricosus]GBO18098.1 hypothetical protein AVEN_172550-1 [Araneus ventricosus]
MSTENEQLQHRITQFAVRVIWQFGRFMCTIALLNPLNGKNISAECFENGLSAAKWWTQMFRSRFSGNKQRATFYAGAGLREIIGERLSAMEPVLE